MNKHTFAQLVGFDRIIKLMEAHHRMTGVLSAMMEPDGTVLVVAGWQDVCLRYHRVRPNGCSRCIEGEAEGIRRRPPAPNAPFRESVCENGLRKILLPIFVAGEHQATFLVAQFFYEDERPTTAYFRGQAEEFGFDVQGYLEALNRVPVLTREQIRSWLEFSRAVITMLAEQGLRSLIHEREAAERKHAEQALKQLNEDLEQRVVDQATKLTAIKADIIREELLRKQSEERLISTQQKMDELNGFLESRTSMAAASTRENDLLLIQREQLSAIEEMIGAISHQWRQPLNVMGLLVQELADTYAHDGLTQESLDHVVSNTMTLLKQISRDIEDFRNFFKPGREKAIFSVSYAIDKSMSFIELSLLRGDIKVERNIIEDLSVVGYPYEYARVVLNILTVSRDLLLERRISHPKISISGSRDGNRSLVTITDNAGGLPDDIANFFSDPSLAAGSIISNGGLKLFMSKSIIEKNMDGTLSIMKTQDGTEFRIEV